MSLLISNENGMDEWYTDPGTPSFCQAFKKSALPPKIAFQLNDSHEQILVWNREQSSSNTADWVVRKKSVGRK